MNRLVTAPNAVGGFSPLREALGLDARELTPTLVRRITHAGAEARSFKRAAIVMKQVAGEPVSAKTIERVVHDIGRELARRRDAAPKTHQNRLPEDFTVCHAGPAQGCAVPNSDAPFGPGFLRRLPEAHCVSA